MESVDLDAETAVSLMRPEEDPAHVEAKDPELTSEEHSSITLSGHSSSSRARSARLSRLTLKKIVSYCNVIYWISKYPLIVLLVFSLIPIGLSGISALFPVQIDFGIDGFKVRDNSVGINFDALTAAEQERNAMLAQYTKRTVSTLDGNSVRSHDLVERSSQVAERTTRKWKLQVVFMAKGGNILEVGPLVQIHEIYRKVLRTPGYSDFCQLTEKGQCYSPQSLIPFLFATVNPDGTLSLTGDADNITNLQKSILTALSLNIYYFTDSQLTPTNLVSKSFRIEFDFGAPLRDYSSANDRLDEQKKKFTNFVIGYESLFDGVNKDSSLPFTLYYGGDAITEYQIQAAIISDAMLAVGSLILILVLMGVHMRSVFLALAGLLQIIVSFPTTYFVYRVVLQVQYVGLLNAISLFLITGVGVDDVFVFYDAFCQANSDLSLHDRLVFTYKKAAKATFVTSITTAAAFFANIVSQIPALRLFGIFMAMIVGVNWLMVITVFPAVLAVWDTRLRHRVMCGKLTDLWKKLMNRSSSARYVAFKLSSSGSYDREANEVFTINTETGCEVELVDSAEFAKPEDKLTSSHSKKSAAQYRKVDLLFHNMVAPFVYKFRFFFLALFIALVGIGGWQTSLLSVAQNAPAFFPQDSNIQQFLNWQQSSFFTGGSWYLSDWVKYGCDNVLGSGKTIDVCGVCGGDGKSCEGCDGVANSNKVYDYCGVCGGDGSTCGSPTSRPTNAPTPTPTPTTPSTPTPTTPSPTTPPTPPPTPAPVSTTSSSSSFLSSSSSSSASTSSSASANSASTASAVATSTSGRSMTSTSGRATSTTTSSTGTVRTSTITTSTTVTATTSTTGSATTSSGGSPCPGGEKMDLCGVCGGDSSSCRSGCDNQPNSKKTVDVCGVCGGDGKSCLGCDGQPNSDKEQDLCGVCGGSNACIGPKPVSSNLVALSMVWGVTGVDRSKVDMNDPFNQYVGDAVYYDKFDLSSTASQLHIVETVQWLKNRTDLTVTQGEQVAGRSVMTSFASWVTDTGKASFPVPPSSFNQLFAEYVNSNKQQALQDVGFTYNPNTGEYHFLWVRLFFKINLEKSTSSFEAINTFDKWEAAMSEINKKSPAALGNGFQTSEEWMRVVTEVVAVQSILQGLVISTTVAVMGALFFTHNIIIAAHVLLVLIGTIVSSLAFFRLMGWELGIVEAISIAVLVGLSVDYCLHLADAYNHSKAKPGKRYPRSQDALTDMGASIVGGALTTIASSFMLLFCTIQIFVKFGLIVTVNTAFSILLTIFVFCPLLMVAGPQRDQGNFIAMFKKLRRLSSRL